MNKLTWNNITIRQYLDILKLTADKSINEMVKMTKLIQICYDLDMNNIPMSTALQYQEDVRLLLSSLVEKQKIEKKYKIGNFTCVPVGFDKMTMALFMDFQLFAGDGEDHLIDTLLICLVPVNHKYNDGYDMDELKDALYGMPITIAPAVFDFFQQRLKKYWKSSLRSLIGKVMLSRELKWKEKIAIVTVIPKIMGILDYFIM